MLGRPWHLQDGMGGSLVLVRSYRLRIHMCDIQSTCFLESLLLGSVSNFFIRRQAIWWATEDLPSLTTPFPFFIEDFPPRLVSGSPLSILSAHRFPSIRSRPQRLSHISWELQHGEYVLHKCCLFCFVLFYVGSSLLAAWRYRKLGFFLKTVITFCFLIVVLRTQRQEAKMYLSFLTP